MLLSIQKILPLLIAAVFAPSITNAFSSPPFRATHTSSSTRSSRLKVRTIQYRMCWDIIGPLFVGWFMNILMNLFFTVQCVLYLSTIAWFNNIYDSKFCLKNNYIILITRPPKAKLRLENWMVLISESGLFVQDGTMNTWRTSSMVVSRHSKNVTWRKKIYSKRVSLERTNCPYRLDFWLWAGLLMPS